MALWSITKKRITNSIEAIVRRSTGQTELTYIEKQIVSDAINSSLIDVVEDFDFHGFTFVELSTSKDCTAGTDYIDLDDGVLHVDYESVRIESENTRLNQVSYVVLDTYKMDQIDPNIPTVFAITNASPDVLRMYLSPVPDLDYTVSYIQHTVVEEDDLAALPSHIGGAMKDKATEVALRDLGMAGIGIPFETSYMTRLKRHKKSHEDAPRYIRRIIGRYDTGDY
jgi:hypothetical protein